MAIDATVGGEDANSYVTLAEADTYMGERLHTEAWDAADEENATKEKALLMACRHLERLRCHEAGGPAYTSPYQALTFPRVRDTDPDAGDYIIPDPVKDAQCEEALALLSHGQESERRARLQESGVESFSVEGLSESYVTASQGSGGSGQVPLISPDALLLMQSYRTKMGRIATSHEEAGEFTPGSD